MMFLKSKVSCMFALVAVLGLVTGVSLWITPSASAQETTGGLQGLVKDQSGAVVPHALVVVKGSSLVGTKEIETDSSGYYRFANLPPGGYTVTVTATAFRTVKRDVTIEGGHLAQVHITR